MTVPVVSAWVLDAILAAMVLEGAGLVLLFRWRHRGVAPGALLPNLISGMCLLLAMRLWLSGIWWPVLSMCLLAALAGHIVDLHARWK